jgi:hypothetical protein
MEVIRATKWQIFKVALLESTLAQQILCTAAVAETCYHLIGQGRAVLGKVQFTVEAAVVEPITVQLVGRLFTAALEVIAQTHLRLELRPLAAAGLLVLQT